MAWNGLFILILAMTVNSHMNLKIVVGNQWIYEISWDFMFVLFYPTCWDNDELYDSTMQYEHLDLLIPCLGVGGSKIKKSATTVNTMLTKPETVSTDDPCFQHLLNLSPRYISSRTQSDMFATQLHSRPFCHVKCLWPVWPQLQDVDFMVTFET